MNKKKIAIIAVACIAVIAIIVTVICVAGKNNDPFEGLAIRGIAAGEYHTSVLYEDGTVATVGGQNELLAFECAQWTDVKEIAAGADFTAVRLSNGFVQTTSSFEGNTTFWRNIVQISAGTKHLVGLCSDGTVVATGDDKNTAKYAVEEWTDIVAVAAGEKYTAGLKSDGTVVLAGSIGADVSGWKKVESLAGGYNHLVGLTKSGKVLTAGAAKADYYTDINWKDVKAIAAGKEITVAVKDNGKVLVAGDNKLGRTAVDDWSDCIAVSCGLYHTVGITTNGTLLCTEILSSVEKNLLGQDDVASLQK
ncbi:MAG: hypothetical protein E7523_07520 [Ruminococcaceae bacterium]|nr:hypothetical protein [Oscillospiraceae bacterium]